MTIEEAWLFWMKTRSTTEPPTVENFDVIKKSSHWAAFEAGWHAAHCNSDGWHSAYNLGLEAGKQIRTHTSEDIKKIQSKWTGLDNVEIAGMTCECVDDGTFNMSCAHDFARAIEAKLKEKNT
jgi:hypothetical protein